MKYKNIIFDFDGVLAESVQIKIEAFHQLYEKYGENIAEKVVEHHKANGGMSRFEKFPYYHKTFLNIDLSKEDIEKLSYHFSNLVVKGVIDAAHSADRIVKPEQGDYKCDKRTETHPS